MIFDILKIVKNVQKFGNEMGTEEKLEKTDDEIFMGLSGVSL